LTDAAHRTKNWIPQKAADDTAESGLLRCLVSVPTVATQIPETGCWSTPTLRNTADDRFAAKTKQHSHLH